jgi:uncharacterized coiled-coil protein SlyX
MNDELRRHAEPLEAALAHLEHQVEQMNEVLIQQGRALDALQKQMRRQSAVLESMEWERIKANQAKPPHYQ